MREVSHGSHDRRAPLCNGHGTNAGAPSMPVRPAEHHSQSIDSVDARDEAARRRSSKPPRRERDE